MGPEVAFLRTVANPHGAEIDIVAVHGLNPRNKFDHATATWAARESKKLWLRDFLPNQLPTARIMIFGYNANVAIDSGSDGVCEQATNLCGRLYHERHKAPNRPLIFVCHSLGGLVVKRAMVLGRINDRYKPIYEATYGFVFFGTPHRGGNHANVGSSFASVVRAILGRPENSFMHALKKGTFYAEALDRDFREIQESFFVLTFYETQPKSNFGMVVDKNSAILGLAGDRELVFGISADHSNICKFETEDNAEYEVVSKSLKELVDNAIKKARESEAQAAPTTPATSVSSVDEAISKPPTTLDSGHMRIAPLHACFLGHPSAKGFCATDDQPAFPTSTLATLVSAHYVKRPEISQRLRDLLTKSTAESSCPHVVLIHGLAGSGKTQLVRNLANTWPKDDCSFYWIDASSLGTLHRSFEAFARDLNLPGPAQRLNAEAMHAAGSLRASIMDWAVVRDVKTFIEDYPGRWLLVFDNYDVPEGYIRRFFPGGSRGHILVTTRNREVETETGGESLHVESMAVAEAVELLDKVSALTEEITEETQMLKESIVRDLLGCLPLAIAQASSYIRNIISRTLSTHQRLQRFKERYQTHESKMLEGDGGSLVVEYGKSVITTWDLTFENLVQGKTIAVELLMLFGFFHHTDIPIALFETVYEARAKLGSEDGIDIKKEPYCWVGELFASQPDGQWDRTLFDTATGHLVSYSLLRATDEYNYSMHPLVHAWTRVCQHSKGVASLAATARLAMAMLAKTHNKKLDWLAAMRKEEHHARFHNHVDSCLRSSKKYTELLEIKSGPIMRAGTLLRLERLMDGEVLSHEARAQRLFARVLLLALVNGCRNDGFDNVSTLQALRAVLLELPNDWAEHANMLEYITHIPMNILPLAASTDPGVEDIQKHLGLLYAKMLALKRLGRLEELYETLQAALLYADTHREMMAQIYYLSQRVALLTAGVSTFKPDQVLLMIDDYMPQCEDELGPSDSCTALLKLGKALCLFHLKEASEAMEVTTSILEDKHGLVARRDILRQALTIRIELLVGEKRWSEVMESKKLLQEHYAQQLGSCHHMTLQEKRDVFRAQIEMEATEVKLSRPRVFGTDRSKALDETIMPGLELALAYRAFGKDEELQLLWEQIVEQTQLEPNRADLIQDYVRAFKIAADASEQGGCGEFPSLLRQQAVSLELQSEKITQLGPRKTQLQRLKDLWDLLIHLENTVRSSEESGSTPSRMANDIYDFIKGAIPYAQPAMLFLVTHYISWMLQLDITKGPFIAPSIMHRLQSLNSKYFGATNILTWRASASLLISYRLAGETEAAFTEEDGLISERIVEAKSRPDAAAATTILEIILPQYTRRGWYQEAVRIYKALIPGLIDLGDMAHDATREHLLPLFDVYGKLSLTEEATEMLKTITAIARQAGDDTKKRAIIGHMTAVATQSLQANHFQIALDVLQWVLTHESLFSDGDWKAARLRDLQLCIKKRGNAGLALDYANHENGQVQR